MKNYLITSCRRVPALTAGLALCTLLASSFPLQAADLGDLDQLADAQPPEYQSLRASLLDAHPTPWDVAAAAAHTWGAGLAAHVLNAWQIHRVQYTAWDAQPVALKASGKPARHPATRARSTGEVYLVEQIWKTAAVPQGRQAAFDVLMFQNLSGPSALWHAVWVGTTNAALKGVALHALANDPSPLARQTLLAALQTQTNSTELKRAALTGLGVARPPYATEVIQLSLAGWSEDLELIGHALRALAAQTDAPARIALHQMAQDTNRVENFRHTAIVAFSDQPRSEDVSVFQALLTTPGPTNLQSRAALLLRRYPISQTRPLLHSLLSSTNQDVVYWAIQTLESQGDLQDVAPLQAVAGNEALPEHLRTAAATAVTTLQQRG